MTTQSRLTELGFFDRLEWPGDNSSNFDYDSLSDSATSSLGYKSVIAEDLDLYKARYVC
jgi:hypothetical protein